MSSKFALPVELPISESTLQVTREDAVDWAHANGLVMRTADRKGNGDLCQAAPVALLPSPFPREVFHQAEDVQKAMNLLYFRISYDFEFLKYWHSEVVKSDDFTRGLMNILGKVMENGGPKQKKMLLTQRSDYMCHVRPDGQQELKQIEVNNIAVSMGTLSERCTKLHRRVLKRLGFQPTKEQVPDNAPSDVLAAGLHQAWKDFGDPKAIVLVVVENVNQNQIDQRWIEYKLEELSEGNIEMVRLNLTECSERVKLDESSGHLLLNGNVRIGLVYFRSGYSPDNYPSEVEWKARETIELSDAIKCPWIGLQAANTKKIQQVLAKERLVERFLPDQPELVPLIRATFAGLWGLENDDEETKAIVEEAKAHPERFVLKPQLEGGGGNFYGQEIVDKLNSMSKDERSAHILMQRIRPLVVKNYLVRPLTETKLSNVVGELGIYGYLYGTMGSDAKPESGVVEANSSGGHIIRSKCEDVNEGGVAVGAAVIDTPFLC